MDLTTEQLRVVDQPLDRHAIVRAAPGSGKTTTLLHRVNHLLDAGIPARQIRVVMYNRSVCDTFVERLANPGVDVRTFHSLGLVIIKQAAACGALTRPLRIEVGGLDQWARRAHVGFRDAIEDADEIVRAVQFWKAHLVGPSKACFRDNPDVVHAYRAVEQLRLEGGLLRVAFSDMVFTAVGILRRHPELAHPVQHLLVDEFQDMNPARLELLTHLIGPDTSVMAVGDEDQAINEWIGASPHLFRRLGTYLKGRPVDELRLSRSFRFGAQLAQAAERVIVRNLDRAPGAVVGSDVPCEIHLVDDPVVAVREALKVHPPCDVAVLYRGRPSGVGAIASLTAAGIAQETEDAEILRRGRGGRLVLAFLAAAHDLSMDEDAVWSLVFCKGSYVRKQPFLDALRRGGDRPVRRTLRDMCRRHGASQEPWVLRNLRATADALDDMARCDLAADALDRLKGRLSLEDRLAATLRSPNRVEQEVANIDALHGLFRQRGTRCVQAADEVTRLDVTLGRPMAERVVVRTIHKAKGLEWPAVVLVGLTDGECPARRVGVVPGTVDEPDGVRQSDWMEQERRIFYVGLTRACRSVWLCSQNPESPFLVEAGLRAPAPVGVVAPAASVKGTVWTPDQEELLERLWGEGFDVSRVAGRVGRSSSAITSKLVRLGLVGSRQEARARGASGGGKWSKDEERRLLQAVVEGQTIRAIAEAHRRTSGAIRSRLKQLNG
ncbi:MAG: DNA helicase-2/ATP-dependent DNA helicase PcrA [Kiritimatiellia bacterium]|jgi:DNA helicase-2/ATP-dependent DNA helicase PcrA